MFPLPRQIPQRVKILFSVNFHTYSTTNLDIIVDRAFNDTVTEAV